MCNYVIEMNRDSARYNAPRVEISENSTRAFFVFRYSLKEEANSRVFFLTSAPFVFLILEIFVVFELM